MCGVHPTSLQTCSREAEYVAFILHFPLGMCLPRNRSSRALAQVVSPWQLWAGELTSQPGASLLAQTVTRFA